MKLLPTKAGDLKSVNQTHPLCQQYDFYCPYDIQSFNSYFIIKALGAGEFMELTVLSLYCMRASIFHSFPFFQHLFFWAQEMGKPDLNTVSRRARYVKNKEADLYT